MLTGNDRIIQVDVPSQQALLDNQYLHQLTQHILNQLNARLNQVVSLRGNQSWDINFVGQDNGEKFGLFLHIFFVLGGTGRYVIYIEDAAGQVYQYEGYADPRNPVDVIEVVGVLSKFIENTLVTILGNRYKTVQNVSE